VNLGKLNEANDIATINISPSNEEPSVLTSSRREEMMQKLSQLGATNARRRAGRTGAEGQLEGWMCV
jgi:hypothetical protein